MRAPFEAATNFWADKQPPLIRYRPAARHLRGKALIIDLTEVDHIGVSSALALEESMLDMIRANKGVFVVGNTDGQPFKRLKQMGIIDRMPAENVVANRTRALEQALYGKQQSSIEGGEPENI